MYRQVITLQLKFHHILILYFSSLEISPFYQPYCWPSVEYHFDSDSNWQVCWQSFLSLIHTCKPKFSWIASLRYGECCARWVTIVDAHMLSECINGIKCFSQVLMFSYSCMNVSSDIWNSVSCIIELKCSENHSINSIITEKKWCYQIAMGWKKHELWKTRYNILWYCSRAWHRACDQWSSTSQAVINTIEGNQSKD